MTIEVQMTYLHEIDLAFDYRTNSLLAIMRARFKTINLRRAKTVGAFLNSSRRSGI